MGNAEEPAEEVEEETEQAAPTEEELNAMTVNGLKAYAADNGIKLTATRKADIIGEILENQ